MNNKRAIYALEVKEVEEADAGIWALLKRFLAEENNTNSDARFKLTYATLYQICKTCKEKDKYYDVYTKVLIRKLLPCWQTTGNNVAGHWSNFLLYTDYFYRLLIAAKCFKEADEVFTALLQIKAKLQSSGDYSYLLGIYSYYLHKVVASKHAAAADKAFSDVITAYQQLFKEMLKRNLEQNFDYPNLINDVRKSLFKEGSRQSLECLLRVPLGSLVGMLQEFFKLVESQRLADKTAERLKEYFNECRKIFVCFLQYDKLCLETTESKFQLTLLFLRSCREAPFFGAVNGMPYFFSIIYNYLKIISTSHKITGFSACYSQLCTKIAGFFEKTASFIAEENWLKNALYELYLILLHTQPKTESSSLSAFWAQMNSAEAQVAHMKMVEKCLELLQYLNGFDAIELACVFSNSKDVQCDKWSHLVSDCSFHAMLALSIYYNTSTEGEEEESEILVKALHSVLDKILQQHVSIVQASNCLGSTALVLQTMERMLIAFMRAIKKPYHAQCFLKVSERLFPLKSKFEAPSWRNVIRCLFKIAEITGQEDVVQDYRACYITSTLATVNQSKLEQNGDDGKGLKNLINLHLMQGRIHEFHQQCTGKQGVSLSEIHSKSTNVFKPYLSRAERCLLHWLETQSLLGYGNKNDKNLLMSLAKSSQTTYQYVLLCEKSKTLQSEALHFGKVRDICKALQGKKREKHIEKSLSRIEELTLGHALAMMVSDAFERRNSSSSSLPKDTKEEKFLDLLHEELRQRQISVQSEWQFIKAINESVQAFKAFYNKADESFIAFDDASYIDWTQLLDTLATLATHLQMTGYIQYALEAWILHYRVADTLDDSINQIRALAFLCEHAALIKTNKLLRFDLDQAVQHNERNLMASLKNLANLHNRQQNFTLICLGNIAFFKATAYDDLVTAKLYLNLGRYYHSQLKNRQGKYDTVQLTFDLIEFRIISHSVGPNFKANSGDVHRALKAFSKSLLFKLNAVSENVKNLSAVASTDNLYSRILLFNILLEFGRCAAHRLYDNPISSYFLSIMQYAVNMSAALRVVQILQVWSYVNLQSEDVGRAELKLELSEFILGIESRDCEKSLCKSQHFDERRRLQDSRPKDIDLSMIFAAIENNEVLKSSGIFQWTGFSLGCLKARKFFLEKDYSELDAFYIKSQDWMQQQFQMEGFNYMQSVDDFFMNVEHHCNYLRRTEQFEKALQCLEKAQDVSKAFLLEHSDALHTVNMMQQKNASHSALAAIIRNNDRVLSMTKRKLKFRTSSQDDNDIENDDPLVVTSSGKSTPLNRKATVSSSASARKTKTVKSSGSLSKNFEIYTDLPSTRCIKGNGVEEEQKLTSTKKSTKVSSSRKVHSVVGSSRVPSAVVTMPLSNEGDRSKSSKKTLEQTSQSAVTSSSRVDTEECDEQSEKKNFDKKLVVSLPCGSGSTTADVEVSKQTTGKVTKPKNGSKARKRKEKSSDFQTSERDAAHRKHTDSSITSAQVSLQNVIDEDATSLEPSSTSAARKDGDSKKTKEPAIVIQKSLRSRGRVQRN